MRFPEIATPALLIDRQKLQQNLQAMQNKAKQEKVRLRPHIKTHKSVDLAKQQQQLGCQGITVAKVAEAEIFAQAGFTDICIAFPVVGETAWQRLLNLQPQATVSVLVDTLAGAKALSEFYLQRGQTQKVFLEIDVGHQRTGITWNSPQLPQIYRFIRELPGLELRGILTHAGQSYQGDVHFVKRVAQQERERMQEVAKRLQQKHLPVPYLSIGSTPTASFFQGQGSPTIDELRPGNYVFYDLEQVALGSTSLENCALTVLTTVVSRQEKGNSTRIFLDAGKKALASETHPLVSSYGKLVDTTTGRPFPNTDLFALSEEHGWVKTNPTCPLQVGDRLRVVPVHACLVANLFNSYYLLEGEEVVAQWPITARGCST